MKKGIIFLIIILILSGCSSVNIDKSEKISRYFTMGEAISSNTAKRRGIKNIPNSREVMNIKYTAKRLDEVRRILNRPVVVTSWFRSAKLNRAVGGSSTSGHRKGLSVDILLKKGRAGQREYEKVKKNLSSYDQLIYYPRRGHLHVGFRNNMLNERRQSMIRK